MLLSPGERQAVLLAVFVLQDLGVISQFGTWYATGNKSAEKMRPTLHLYQLYVDIKTLHQVTIQSSLIPRLLASMGMRLNQ